MLLVLVFTQDTHAPPISITPFSCYSTYVYHSLLPALQGKLKSYSAQTGKFTLQYDDGQCEQLLLERERFVWHAPRGMTAGYKPALHTLMQQLGAEGLKALPQEGPDGKIVPITPRPEVCGLGGGGYRVVAYCGT